MRVSFVESPVAGHFWFFTIINHRLELYRARRAMKPAEVAELLCVPGERLLNWNNRGLFFSAKAFQGWMAKPKFWGNHQNIKDGILKPSRSCRTSKGGDQEPLTDSRTEKDWDRGKKEKCVSRSAVSDSFAYGLLMDCSPPGSSVHGISQARILEWVAIPFSRGPSWPRDRTWVSLIAGRFFTVWATREVQEGEYL